MLYSDLLPPLQQTKQKWTAVPAPRTRSSTTCWSSCSRATVRWRSESPAPSVSTTTSSWSSSVDTPPASTAAQRSRPARSAGRPSASGSSCLSERRCALSSLPPKQEVEGWGGGSGRVERGGVITAGLCLWHLPAHHSPSTNEVLAQPTGCFTVTMPCCIAEFSGCSVFSSFPLVQEHFDNFILIFSVRAPACLTGSSRGKAVRRCCFFVLIINLEDSSSCPASTTYNLSSLCCF